MNKNLCAVILCISMAACGGSGGDSSNQTTVNSCPGQQVHVGDVDQIVAEAQSAGAEVVESEDAAPQEVAVAEPEPSGSLDQGAVLREGGVIVATCGSTVVANDTNSVSNTARVIAAIRSGDVYKIEIYRGE